MMDTLSEIQKKETQKGTSEPEESLFQLIYISRARYSELFRYGIFNNIAQSARKNNRAKNITAILCFGNGYFLQYAEGNEQSLTNLKNKILKDKRHHSFQLCDFKEIKNRRFPNVYQGFVVIDKRHKFSESGLRDYLPMTPYKWGLEKKIQLIDTIEHNNLVEEDFRLSNAEMIVIRTKLLLQLAGDNLNHKNRVFWLSVLFFLSYIGVLIISILN